MYPDGIGRLAPLARGLRMVPRLLLHDVLWMFVPWMCAVQQLRLRKWMLHGCCGARAVLPGNRCRRDGADAVRSTTDLGPGRPITTEAGIDTVR